MSIERINIDTFESAISEILSQENAVLVDFTLKNITGNPIIQIFTDTEKGISAEELAQISRKIEKFLDANEQFPKNYRMDVSSPGIERPLKFSWQYTKNIGRDLKITYRNNDAQDCIIGKLESADDHKIILKTKKEDLELPFSQIIEAVVQIRFK